MLKSFVRTSCVALALAACASTANAAVWNLLQKQTGGSQLWFFDAATVERQGSTVRVWIKGYRFKSADKDGAWITAAREEYDCVNRSLKTITASDYDQKGQFIRSWNTPSKANLVAPDTVAEYLLEMVCRKGFPLPAGNDTYARVKDNNPQAHYERYLADLDSSVDQAPR